MIALERDRSAIAPRFLGANRRTHLLALYSAAARGILTDKETKKRIFSSTHWAPSKDQLGLETHGKCAFCEAPNSATYYGDVEHFRPKSVYWWLAYCYDNYLYSCRICNGTKSDLHTFGGAALIAPQVHGQMTDDELIALADIFSPSPTDAGAVAAYDALCRAELGGLPNPYQEEPEDLFVWEAYPDVGEVRIAPAPGNPRALQAFEAVTTIIGLNRAELLTQRFRTFELAKRIFDQASLLPDPHRQPLLDIVRDLTDSRLPFSAMMRYFVRQWGLLS